jgi:hypothetical protein
MTEAEEVGGAPRKQARRRKPTVTTATGLGLHLGLSRQRVVQLADEGVIGGLDDGGFDETACRLKYLDWLRSSERRSARSAVEAEFLRAKTVALEIRTEERLGNLVPRQVLEDAIDIIVGMYRAELGGLPASFTRDVSERRRLERLVNELLKRVANEAYQRSQRVCASTDDGREEAFGAEVMPPIES